MVTTALLQTAVFDVARWEQDAEFGVFPQGARAKDAVFAPVLPSEPVLVGGKRYLFKRSKRSYPDQFWGEVIAYRVGCLLGVSVPPAFAAWNSQTGYCAALIEWFYLDGSERFVMGGDFLQRFQPDYDRAMGTKHNLEHITMFMRAIAGIGSPVKNWRQWWLDALLFDALIGNTDRHQDNWGLIFKHRPDKIDLCRMSPLFDNGTSLGHERFTDRVRHWTSADLDRYILRGQHHVKWSLHEVPPINGHFALLRRAVVAWPQTLESARNRLNFAPDALAACCEDLVNLPIPVPLTAERMQFVLRLLKRRHQLLIDTLDECLATAPHR